MNDTATLNRHDAALTGTPVGTGAGPLASNLPGAFQSSKLVPRVIQNGIDGAFNLVNFDQNLNDVHIQTINSGKNCLCCLHINTNRYITSVSMNRQYLPLVPIDTALT